MENSQENLEDSLRNYIISSYVPDISEEVENTLPKELLEQGSSELYANQFLKSFYDSSKKYEKGIEEFNDKILNINSLEKKLSQEILKSQKDFHEYLTRNESVLEKLNIVAKHKGFENLTQEDKYSIIRSEFETVEDYVDHIQKGLNAYAQNTFYIAQLIMNPQSQEFKDNIAFTENLLSKYSQSLLNEAQDIYGVKFSYADDYGQDDSKAA